MPVIIVGTEKNFAALRSRLFTGTVSTKAVGEVSSAIQAANPQADLKALQPGTVLYVPDDLPHVAVLGDVSLDATSTQAVSGFVTAGTTAITQLASTAKTSASAATAERKLLVKTLGAKEVVAAASKDKVLAASLKATQDTLAAADAQTKSRADALAQAKSEWGAELKAVQATLPS